MFSTCLGLALSTNILYIFIFPAPKRNLELKKTWWKKIWTKMCWSNPGVIYYTYTSKSVPNPSLGEFWKSPNSLIHPRLAWHQLLNQGILQGIARRYFWQLPRVRQKPHTVWNRTAEASKRPEFWHEHPGDFEGRVMEGGKMRGISCVLPKKTGFSGNTKNMLQF